MKIIICYPPYRKGNKVAFLPQNRQFIYSASSKVRLYPVLPAIAATMLKQMGHQVLWLDAITENLDELKFYRQLFSFKPDLVVTETKTPVLKKTWKFIHKLKDKNKNIKTVLTGDHVTYFPEEQFRNCPVDYVLTGGDWDFLLKNLVEYLQQEAKLEQGIYYRKKGHVINTGQFKPNHSLDDTPVIDRELTKFQLYREADVLTPCAYMMFGRGCGGVGSRPGTCTFCIWQNCLWANSPRLRSPEHVVREIKYLLQNYHLREIFDDTDGGAHYNLDWLKRFYQLLKKEKILGQVSFATNSRADVLNNKTCKLLKKCNFRMLKVGVECGTGNSLKKLAKGETIKQIRFGIKNAKDNGLVVHLSAMVGFPWENETDVRATYQLMKELLLYRTKAGDSLQASLVVPYPGTPLWKQALKEKWFIINPLEFEKYDMSQEIMQSSVDNALWCKKIWNLHLHPLFLMKTIFSIRSLGEVSFLLKGAFSHFGHTQDYE